MYKKLFGFVILSLLGAGSLLAGSHGSVFKVEGTCANKHSAMRTMGELPLHFAGEMNCVERMQIKGKNRYWINLHLFRTNYSWTDSNN